MVHCSYYFKKLEDLFFDKVYEKFIEIVKDLKKLPKEQQFKEWKISQISKKIKFPEDILLKIIYSRSENNQTQSLIKKLIKNIYCHERGKMANQKTNDIFLFLSKTKTYRLSNYLIADEFGYSCNCIYSLKNRCPEIYQYLEEKNKNSEKIISDLIEDFTNLIKEAPVDAFNDTKNLLEYFLEKNFFYFHNILHKIFKTDKKNFNDMINEFNKIYKQKTSKEENFFFISTFYELFEEFIKYHQNDNSVNKAEIHGTIPSNQIIFEEQNSELSIYAQKSDINKSNIYGVDCVVELQELKVDDVIDSLNRINSEEENCELIDKPNNTCNNFSHKRKLDQEDSVFETNKKNKNDEEFYINPYDIIDSNIDEAVFLLDEVISSQTQNNKLNIQQRIN